MKLEPKCNKCGFKTRLGQTLRLQSQTITVHWISEARSISMFSSVSERQRVTTKRPWCFEFWMITEGWGALIKKEGASSYPRLHYDLDDRNGCRLETKSLRLIPVTQTSCTAPKRSRVNAAANITYHYFWLMIWTCYYTKKCSVHLRFKTTATKHFNYTTNNKTTIRKRKACHAKALPQSQQ